MKIIARKLGGVYLVQVSRDQGAGERVVSQFKIQTH